MSATEEMFIETEPEKVERWRLEELTKAGYDSESAGVLAICDDVDLHEAVNLLVRGCKQDIALQILL